MHLPGNPRDDRGKALPLLAAFCFFLSTIEYLIPKPLPFLRIGLANLPLLLAIDLLPLPSYLLLAALKVTGQGLLSGGLFSWIFLFSLAGTAASAPLMYALRKFAGDRMSRIGISILGSLASNLAQLLIAGILVFGPSATLIAPPFLAVGLVTGILLGLFAERFAEKSVWYRGLSCRQ